MNNYASKVRLLRLWEILANMTSESEPMSTRDIIEELSKYGFDCDRRTVYGDIKQLRENGYKVGNAFHNHSNHYYAVGRLSEADMDKLVDMVYESCMTAEAKEELINRLFVSVAQEQHDVL